MQKAPQLVALWCVVCLRHDIGHQDLVSGSVLTDHGDSFPDARVPAEHCLNFAQFEMKMLLASILPRVSLELMPGQDFRPQRIGLALAPPTGVN